MVIFASCEEQNKTGQEKEKENYNPVAEKPKPGYSGIIQSAGLNDDEIEQIGLGKIDFQLISGEESYFILSEENIETYWGSCVAIEADTVAIPDPKLNLYGRKIIRLKSINKAFSEDCIYVNHPVEAQGENETLTGKVIRSKRPAPDIAYDYKLVLAQPFKDEFSQYEENFMVEQISLSHITTKVYTTLEEAIAQDKKISLTGVKTRGYAEELVFTVKMTEL